MVIMKNVEEESVHPDPEIGGSVQKQASSDKVEGVRNIFADLMYMEFPNNELFYTA